MNTTLVAIIFILIAVLLICFISPILGFLNFIFKPVIMFVCWIFKSIVKAFKELSRAKKENKKTD